MTNDGRQLRRNPDFGVAPGSRSKGLKPSPWKAGIFPCGGRAGPSCAKWISALTLTNCVDSSKILEPVLDGRDWHEKEKVMHFLSGRRYIAVGADGKVQFWGKRGWMNWNARCRGAH
jgi:hypothetical protein